MTLYEALIRCVETLESVQPQIRGAIPAQDVRYAIQWGKDALETYKQQTEQKEETTMQRRMPKESPEAAAYAAAADEYRDREFDNHMYELGEMTEYNVVAVAADASMYHLDCAVHVYGTEATTDHEGNEITPIYIDSEDLTDETGQPHSCGRCLGYLIEDERPSDSPLARDIMNLSAEYREEAATIVLSLLARYVRERPYTIDTVIAETEEYYKSFRFQHGDNDVRTLTSSQSLRMMVDWRNKWNSREIIHLTHTSPGKLGRQSYVDMEGNEWEEYDMEGYLDMYNNGESECESCGRRIESHCFLDEVETAYCPNCVVIE